MLAVVTDKLNDWGGEVGYHHSRASRRRGQDIRRRNRPIPNAHFIKCAIKDGVIPLVQTDVIIQRIAQTCWRDCDTR